jgi:hypothetical protein
MTRLNVGASHCGCGEPQHGVRLVAVTGGPGAGKTAILETALHTLCNHVGVLPESASMLFGGGFPRHDSDIARRASQRAIFHVQRELEALVVGERSVAVALCDRGTLDGTAYWPGTVDDFFEEVGTTLEVELRRYAAVIHMRTPPAGQGYNHRNSLRVESAAEARKIDDKIEAIWSTHPNRHVIESQDDFVQKALRALVVVREQLPPCCRAHAPPSSGV